MPDNNVTNMVPAGSGAGTIILGITTALFGATAIFTSLMWWKERKKNADANSGQGTNTGTGAGSNTGSGSTTTQPPAGGTNVANPGAGSTAAPKSGTTVRG